MGASVSTGRPSVWNPHGLAYGEACRQAKAQIAAHKAACADHPLAGAYDGVSDESRAASEAPYWRGSVKIFGNGVKRVVISRVVPDPQATLDRAIGRDVALPTGMEVEPDPAEWRERNARRARGQVVDKCIAASMNSLFTLTFRENVVDLDEAWRCFDLFRRKVSKLLPGWRYVVTHQRQERGAWHFHLASHALPVHFTKAGVKLKSWNVMRKLWQASAGSYGGNFDEAKPKRRNGAHVAMRRCGQIARYIARYIGREIGKPADDATPAEKAQFLADQELLASRKSYAATKGIEVPKPLRYLWDGDTALLSLIQWAHDQMPRVPVTSWLALDIGVFFIESNASKPVG